jgi:hypothetical protein
MFIATLIATMDVDKPTGEDGKPMEQEIRFSTGLSSHPGKFDVAFKPRSEQARRLLMEWRVDTE